MSNILAILQQHNAITPSVAREIASSASTNFEIEKILREKYHINDKLIAMAYAEFYHLPFISLAGKKIDHELLTYLPENLARKYQVIVFDKENDCLKIAVANPAYLKENASGVLAETVRKKGWRVVLSITTKEDLEAALANYQFLTAEDKKKPALLEDLFPKAEAGAPTVSSGPIPPTSPTAVSESRSPDRSVGAPKIEKPAVVFETVSLKNIRFQPQVLLRLPESIAKKYKIVVFAVKDDGAIKVAAANPEDKAIADIIDFIEERNKIKIELYKADINEINEVLKKYDLYAKPAEKVATNKEQVATDKKEEKPEEKPAVTSKETSKETPKEAVPKITPTGEKLVFERNKVGAIIIKPDQLGNILLGEEAEGEVSGEEIAKLMEEQNLDKFLGDEIVDSDQKLAEIIVEGNLPKIVAAIVSLAITSRASDIHLEPLEDDLRLRYRVDGVLKEIMRMPLDLEGPIVSRVKILAKLKIDEQRIPQDGRFQVTVAHRDVDLRVSILPTIHKEKAVIRILDKSSGLLTLEQIGARGQALELLKKEYEKPFGIILATGPTGSGKSTTLYAIINEINKPGVNVVTLEDPVEFEIKNVNQCQIKPKIGFTFAEGLRSILRQDPNVIMVGEIRDRETADMAIHAALTGHLVLSTLHTNDAPSAIPRLINMGIEPFLITSALNASLAQRLVRRICDKCKAEIPVPEELKTEIKRELVNLKIDREIKFFKGKGCPACANGYHGRIALFEILPMTSGIEDLAVKRVSADQIREEAIKEGMVTMKQDGILKVLDGLTTIDEVLRVTTAERSEDEAEKESKEAKQ